MDGTEDRHISHQKPAPPAPPRWPFLRDVLLFVIGTGGIYHETVIAEAAEPTLIVLFAACLGLPMFLRRDEAK